MQRKLLFMATDWLWGHHWGKWLFITWEPVPARISCGKCKLQWTRKNTFTKYLLLENMELVGLLTILFTLNISPTDRCSLCLFSPGKVSEDDGRSALEDFRVPWFLPTFGIVLGCCCLYFDCLIIIPLFPSWFITKDVHYPEIHWRFVKTRLFVIYRVVCHESQLITDSVFLIRDFHLHNIKWLECDISNFRWFINWGIRNVANDCFFFKCVCF